MPVVSISSSSAPAQAISSMVWLASTGKYWQVAPASLRAPISRRSRAPLPDPKLITGTRPPKCLASSPAVSAIVFQVSHRPPYNSACSPSAAHSAAERVNQKKNFSGRSRASMASANSCAISASVRTTSTFIFGTRTSIIASETHDLHAGIDKKAISRDTPPQIACQEDRRVGDFGWLGVAPQGRAGLYGVENGREVLNGPRRRRLDGA